MNNDRDASTVSGNMPDEFDRLMGNLQGLPGVISVRETTLTVVPPFGMGGTRTFIIQTYRQREIAVDSPKGVKPAEDTVFIQCIGKDMSLRLALPDAVAQAIARQRDALATKSRSRAGKARAAADKAAGIKPGFLRHKKGKK